MLKHIIFLLFLLPLIVNAQICIVFTSDLHYGLKRHFRGTDSVTSKEVNDAQIVAISSLGKTCTPIFVFVLDLPEGDPKYFTNPNGDHSINATDKFENHQDEHYTDHAETDWAGFLLKHPQIKAYFHRHSNYHVFYATKEFLRSGPIRQ